MATVESALSTRGAACLAGLIAGHGIPESYGDEYDWRRTTAMQMTAEEARARLLVISGGPGARTVRLLRGIKNCGVVTIMEILAFTRTGSRAAVGKCAVCGCAPHVCRVNRPKRRRAPR